MRKKTVTFRLEKETTDALDQLAKQQARDRSFVLKEAVSAYIDLHKWQTDRIKEGLRQANKGQFASEDEVAAAFKRWKK